MRLLKITLTLIVAGFALWLTLPARSSAMPATGTNLPPELLIKLHPALARQLLSEPDAPVRVQIVMRDQAAPLAVTARNRAAAIADLQAQADRSQAGVRTLLAASRAVDVRPLWINNSIAARIDRATVMAVAERNDVALVKLDEFRQWIEPLKFSDPISNLHAKRPTSIQWGVAQIHADQVWTALGITGTGVVVANMDTGVDWQHPILHGNYRGLGPTGLVNHAGSWIDTTDEGAVYPFDGYGHGTHTMGTLAGQDGIGVAPGARWIAARVLNSQGYGLDSWIHAGFQWILAPGGDPTLAPDILSNSWGNPVGADEEFRPDVQLLNAAGIFTVFSNGNSGPDAGIVSSPASYPESFAVGATDQYDLLALFSSRGPSPFEVLKPDVSAPGVNVLSSMPGGVYALASGTSMAAPHVAGAAALMYAAAPGLSIAAARFALTSTVTRPTTGTYPNNSYGWGRIDAYRAVLAVAHPGYISGTLTRADSGAPIAGGTVQAQSAAGTFAAMTSDAQGRYQLPLPAARYTVTAAAFSYAPQTHTNLMVLSDTITLRDFALTPQPIGLVEGRLLDMTGTHLLSGTLSVVGAPAGAPINLAVSGTYSLILPVGTHVLEVRAMRHRVITATVTIDAGQRVAQDFHLPDAPTILLVDSGRWYNASVERYYRQALTDLNYVYDEWPIINPGSDVPTTTTLRAYDTVIWSSPLDSPGYIGADVSLYDYLRAGGHLFLSGQDVGYLDAYWGFGGYLTDQLFARFVADNGPTRVLTGQNGYAGQVVTLTGGDGADNQLYPDVITTSEPLLTENAFDYLPGQSGGQTVGQCEPYRAAYLSFGFESINNRAARSRVLSTTLASFARPLVAHEYVLDHAPEPIVGPPGSLITGVVKLHNLDEVATSTTFALSVDGAWPATISPTLAIIKSCETQPVTVTVTLPANAAIDEHHLITITATPIDAPAWAVSTPLTFKTPGSVLLVNDDRWYFVDGPYRAALDANHVTYDLWRGASTRAGIDPGSPPTDRLSWYPEVIWFTGYDWYQTLTEADEQSLVHYLNQGGRLLLSSQDYLGQRGFNDFGRNVLGLFAFSGDVQDQALGGAAGSLFDGVGWQSFSPPYPNYTDALAPRPEAQVAWIGQHGWPTAVARTYGISKTLFMGFGFEGLPAAIQPEAMNRSVGYLSWLGSSSVKFDRASANMGDVVTTTIVIANDGPRPIAQAAFTLSLPSNVIHAGGAALTWSGALNPRQSVTHTLALTIIAGGGVTLSVQFVDVDHQLPFTATARLPITASGIDLSLIPSGAPVVTGQVMTWTLTAHNRSALDAATVITSAVPFDMLAISGTLHANLGEAAYYSDTIGWRGLILAGESVTVTYQMTAPKTATDQKYYASAIALVGDQVWQAGSWLSVQPRRVYLPIVRK